MRGSLTRTGPGPGRPVQRGLDQDFPLSCNSRCELLRQALHEGVAPVSCEKIALGPGCAGACNIHSNRLPRNKAMNVWVAERPFTLESIATWSASPVLRVHACVSKLGRRPRGQ